MNAEKIIERNEEYLEIVVSCFMRKCRTAYRGGMVSREDLRQEVTLCFLAEAEQYGEETARAHRLTLFRAMYDEVRRAYPVHIPHRAFRQGTRQPLQVEPWEAMGNRIRQTDPTEKAVDRIDLQRVLEVLDETDRHIIKRRMDGDSQRDIARGMGLNDVQMCRRIKRIRRQLEQAD